MERDVSGRKTGEVDGQTPGGGGNAGEEQIGQEERGGVKGKEEVRD